MADKYEALVTSLYETKFKQLKLPPKHVTLLKDVLKQAAKKSKGDKKETRKAGKAWLYGKGYGADDKKASEVALQNVKEKKPAAKGKATSPAPELLEKHGVKKTAMKGDPENGVPKDNIDMRKLDRPTLKGMAKDLGVPYDKEMSDEALREAVSKAMIGVDDAVQAKMDKIDPQKVNLLPECIGLFIDLTKAACIACPLQSDCRDLFEKNRQNGFVAFDSLLKKVTDKKTESEPLINPPKKAKEEETKPNKRESTVESYDKDAMVRCFELEGSIKDQAPVRANGTKVKDHSEHKDLIKAVMKKQPQTVGAVRSIILSHYDPDEDSGAARKKLVSFFLAYLQALGVINIVK